MDTERDLPLTVRNHRDQCQSQIEMSVDMHLVALPAGHGSQSHPGTSRPLVAVHDDPLHPCLPRISSTRGRDERGH